MDIKYSVIIPAYNAEKTLNRCIDSLIDRQRDDVELIIINDGSTDQTEKICQEYIKSNDNVRYYSKENGGVSSARNLGLQHAKGRFISFVDSDDFVKSEYFDVLDDALQSDADFVLLAKLVYDGADSITQSIIRNCSARSYDVSSDVLSLALKQQFLNAPSSKVFKKQIIENNKIRFDERLPIGEDKVFVVQYIMHAETVEFVNSAVYFLSIENQDSLSRKRRSNLSEYILLEHKLMFEAVNKSALSDINKKKYLKALSYSYYRSAYTVIAELYKYNYSKKDRLKEMRIICEKYNKFQDCKDRDLRCILIAIPIRLCLCKVIDFMLNRVKR